ncbi:GPW/gp25 family protein [Leptolyngbya sp. FACHB-321]|uniref:GPW/gp25 family protein n=1 Tax=Leptolyngbya sp. FACHB-321 TaxID=2692807 RepID=UPI0016832EF9|nr:GPW/gp25 family protein [Leptolyngbya sp. FACHB-321]MBD2037663.1 GPW/gp25 family protein [Leptolyngbya sp. FACHB-321]
MRKLFLGRGLGFPIKLNNGNLDVAEYEESVRQSIVIILGTAKGERVMRPDFGCGIYDLVFEVKTAATAGRVSQAVQEALLLFEPRIDVVDVEVIARSDETGEMLLINVTYEVRATNNVFNLVYPFYLERSPSL